MEFEVKKGLILVVKVPPYYEKEYFYEVSGAGEKLIRANLLNSPKVKKNWTVEQFESMVVHGIIRAAKDHEKPKKSE